MIAFLHFPSTVGYAGVAILVGIESAGVPVPGETSLIAAAVLASQGHLSLPLVIVVAASAAIVGDNVGYLIGRRGGRWLLTQPGRWERSRTRLLERGEVFFARHGAKPSSSAAGFLGSASPLPGSQARTGCRGRVSLLERAGRSCLGDVDRSGRILPR